MNKFKDRLEIQREVIGIINEGSWFNEPLVSLSYKAIIRWALANNINKDSKVVCILEKISSDLMFMANKSQSPITSNDAVNYETLNLEVRNLKIQLLKANSHS